MVTAEVPEVYMHQFWNTIQKIKDTDAYRFKMDKKKFRVDTEVFCEILHICPRLHNQDFFVPPSEEELVTFIQELGYSGKCDMLSAIHTDQMHQRCKTFAAIINRCISGKTTRLDRLRESRAQILWGIYNKKNVDYVALLWEYFMYQADNREISSARKEHTPYPRFTKVIISNFISKDKTISMRNMINLHIIYDDSFLGTLKFVSKTQDYQQYGSLIPDDMINQDIKDSKYYKTYYDVATGKATPKKARKYKKVASPSRKLSPVLEEEHAEKPKRTRKPAKKSTTVPTAGVAIKDTLIESVPKKKTPTKVDRDAEREKERKGDTEMIDADKNVSQERSYEQVVDETHVTLTITQNTKGSMQSSSVSSDFASKFINLDNVPLADNEVASMMNVKVHREESSTLAPPLLTVHVTAIPETSTVATTTVPLIIQPFSSIPQMKTPTPVPTTEPTTSSIPALLDFASIFGFDQRVSALEQELSQVKQVDNSAQILAQIPAIVDEHLSTRIGFATQTALQSYTTEFEKKAQAEKEISDFATPVIQSTINESLENVVLAKSSSQPQSIYKATSSLTEFELKKILLDKLEKSKSYRAAKQHRDLYDALVKSYQLDKDLFETLMSAQAEEPVFETADTEMPQDQGDDLGNTEDQPKVKEDSKHDWFKKPKRPPTPARDWNAGKQIDFRPPQTWISKIAKAGKPPTTFDELMSTPIDFLA
ncbi:hypothetical protein Tco_0671983 [Tanacetum coccineum]